MTNAGYRKLTTRIIAAWFVFSVVGSAFNLFRAEPYRPAMQIGLAGILPILIFWIWFKRSKGFREFAYSLDSRLLTSMQSWRIGGFVFLVLYTFRILPGVFALPSGWGDIAIGATAPWVALKWITPRLANARHRNAFVVWQYLGVLDLVLAVTLGISASFLDPAAFPTNAMTVLPMSFIPVFAVPLLLIFHIVCIAQAKRGVLPLADSSDRVLSHQA